MILELISLFILIALGGVCIYDTLHSQNLLWIIREYNKEIENDLNEFFN